ncbi:MAG: hypothetical protein CMN30_16390 [Sandaracinus sp.]|nr:hypothetical protein [Sandaracinus sp.]
MFAYPPDLARRLPKCWPGRLAVDPEALEHVLSVAYQASLMREEGRAVRFRLLVARPEEVGEAEPLGAQRLAFEPSRELSADELRRLSPATGFTHTLIGVSLEGGEPRIWGIVNTGPSWLARSWGGRALPSHGAAPDQLPEHAPVIHVTGPGRILVHSGETLVAALERGKVTDAVNDVFSADWLSALFAGGREELHQRHRDATGEGVWAEVDDSLVHNLSQHMVRRALTHIRQAAHGGMLLFADPSVARGYLKGQGTVRVKYGLADGAPRRRYRSLTQRVMRSLAEAREGAVGWDDFVVDRSAALREVEDAIFELSRSVAMMAAVDGAVLLDKRFEILGFGAEVSAELPTPPRVWEALDPAGEQTREDRAESVGTRHHAAYRFVTAHPEGLAVVVSHDGTVRFVAHRDGRVVWWEQFFSG